MWSLKQHMESKYNVFTNITIVLVVTQDVESQWSSFQKPKTKENMLKQPKQDINSTNTAQKK